MRALNFSTGAESIAIVLNYWLSMDVFRAYFSIIGKKITFCYAAIGGAGKQQAVDRLKYFSIMVIIATDNDAAGDECRAKNPD